MNGRGDKKTPDRCLTFFVPKVGVEPTHAFAHKDLNLACLPVPPLVPGGRGYRAPGVATGSVAARFPRVSDQILTPTAAENPLMEGFQTYNKLLQERIVFLGTDVNDSIANQICAQLLYLEGQDAEKDIFLYINSPGGSVTAGMAIYDTMNFVAPDVSTICMGLAASMGQFLLCAGAQGKRFSLPHARIMMHQPSGGFQGQAADIAIQAEQLVYIKQLMAERIAEHTGQTVEQIREDSERDRWFTADQAVDYGMVDKVIAHRGDA